MKETCLANNVTSILRIKMGHLICPPMVCHCWIRLKLGAFDRRRFRPIPQSSGDAAWKDIERLMQFRNSSTLGCSFATPRHLDMTLSSTLGYDQRPFVKHCLGLINRAPALSLSTPTVPGRRRKTSQDYHVVPEPSIISASSAC
jgi:hypothetical protein